MTGYSFELLKASGSYSLFGIDDSFEFGPVVDLDGDLTVATIGVYDNTFGLDFASGALNFGA